MAARRDRAREAQEAERRRGFVKKFRFRDQLPYGVIVERLRKLGIETTKATICRDVAVIKREYRQAAQDFDALEKVGQCAADFRVVVSRALRASAKATDATDVARLLKVVVLAQNSEISLLQSVGLLPNQLGTLKVEQPTGKIPSGAELQRLFESVTVEPSELQSSAELAMLYGDAEASERAAREAKG